MKLERERDIPAFKGKVWRERWVLRNKAMERDPLIYGLRFLGFILIIVPTVMLANWFGHQFFPNQYWLVNIGFIVLLYPVYMLFQSLFITPKIRKALESDAKPSA